MEQRCEYRVANGSLEDQITRMSQKGWLFVWAGHYDLLPYIVFECEIKSE